MLKLKRGLKLQRPLQSVDIVVELRIPNIQLPLDWPTIGDYCVVDIVQPNMKLNTTTATGVYTLVTNA